MIKKLCKLISCLLCILLLVGCSNKEDPNEGKYSCKEISYDGVTMKPDEFYEGEVYLMLIRGGKGNFVFGAEGGRISWEVVDGKLSVDIDGNICQGKIKDDVLTLKLYDSGVNMTFVKETEESLAKNNADADNGLSGGWYGWWRIVSAQGGWSGYKDMWYDLCAEIEFEENKDGRIKLWDEDYTAQEPMALVHLELNEDGTATSQGGYFMACPVNEGDWILDSTAGEYSQLIRIYGNYTDSSGSFQYELFLRPWGIGWGDMEIEDSERLPYYYYDWYIPLIQAEAPMPESIG